MSATMDRTSTLIRPPENWWGPLGLDEKLWALVSAVWAVSMFVMMLFVWPAIGNEQVTFDSYSVEPAEFAQLADAFIAEHQVGELAGLPIVEPPPGDVYLLANRFQFRPLLRLKQGETYRLLLSSSDVQHGFSMLPDNVNFQVMPGYISAISLTPEEAGAYPLLCNEYCGTGHHLMLGRIEVVE